MIIGIGADLCHIEHIRRSLRRFGNDYLDQLFTNDERLPQGCDIDFATLYARTFCGKQACAKALGTGIAEGVNWRNIEFLHEKGTLNPVSSAAIRFVAANAVLFP